MKHDGSINRECMIDPISNIFPSDHAGLRHLSDKNITVEGFLKYAADINDSDFEK